MVETPLLTIVLPIYKNEDSIEQLVHELAAVAQRIDGGVECVFVIDASPDLSRQRLVAALPNDHFHSTIVDHSRNFGSFAAIRTGLQYGRGRLFGVMAADLQEPPELMIDFVEQLNSGECQVVVGERASRSGDQTRARIPAQLFWTLYRRYVLPTIPAGGVDVFGCTREVRDRLLDFRESNSSLIGLLFWLGFATKSVSYDRRARADGGVSSWTFRKKIKYMMDSIYSFTDLPLRILRAIGAIGLLVSLICSIAVTIAWAKGAVSVPGYTPLILALFAATMMIMTALGIVGSYVWRGYENTKRRPLSVVEGVQVFESR